MALAIIGTTMGLPPLPHAPEGPAKGSPRLYERHAPTGWRSTRGSRRAGLTGKQIRKLRKKALKARMNGDA